MADIMKKHPEIKEWGVVGYCWGAKMAALCSREGSVFRASALLHPSLLEQEDAGKVTVPMCVLASVDEIPEVYVLPGSCKEKKEWSVEKVEVLTRWYEIGSRSVV
jgi:dienelactone hydrolase